MSDNLTNEDIEKLLNKSITNIRIELNKIKDTLTRDMLNKILDEEKKGSENRKTKLNRKGVKNIINGILNPDKGNRNKSEYYQIQVINNNETTRQTLCNKLEIEYNENETTKPKSTELKYTPIWKFLKKGTNETRVQAKTDIILPKIKLLKEETDICNTNEQETELTEYDGSAISLKEKKGRATSADVFETTAILVSTFRENEKNYKKIKYDTYKLYSIIHTIITLMKNLEKHTICTNNIKNYTNLTKCECKHKNDKLWLARYFFTKYICNKYFKELQNNYIEYIKDVLFECYTGINKFGESSSGCAKYLLVTKLNENKTDFEILQFFDMKQRSEDFDKYALSTIPKTPFHIKTSGPKLWMILF